MGGDPPEAADVPDTDVGNGEEAFAREGGCCWGWNGGCGWDC